MIVSVMKTSRELDMTGTFQGNQYFPAGHILQSAIGLDPVPSLTEFSGNVSTATIPIFIDGVLN